MKGGGGGSVFTPKYCSRYLSTKWTFGDQDYMENKKYYDMVLRSAECHCQEIFLRKHFHYVDALVVEPDAVEELNDAKVALQQLFASVVQDGARARGKIEAEMTHMGRYKANAKKALLRVAYSHDPLGASCAEALGHLWLRTPVFFFQSDMELLLQFRTQKQQPEHSLQNHDLEGVHQEHYECLLHIDTESDIYHTWRIFRHVDMLIERAVQRQDEHAVRELMTIMHTDELPQRTHDHLSRVVNNACELARTNDEKKKLHSRVFQEHIPSCAVTCCWPDHNQAPNWEAYTRLFKYLPQKDVNETKNEIDMSYHEALIMDPLMHITKPHIVPLLWKLVHRSLFKLMQQDLILYNFDYGFPEQVYWKEEAHWRDRREATKVVHEFASRGNEFAINLICDHLLFDKHWTVLQLAIEAACQLMAELPPGHRRLPQIHKTLVKLAFGILDGDTASKEKSGRRETDRMWQHIQTSAQDGLCENLPNVCEETRAQFLVTLGKIRSGSGSEQKKT